MKLIAIAVTFLLSSTASAQETAKTSYMIIRMQKHFDNINRKSFYAITADPYINANQLYSLTPYDPKKYMNTTAVFYSDKSDTSTSVYNYFRNHTDALNFLSEAGWELLTVQNEITSGLEKSVDNNQATPYTIISSEPVYYLKKATRFLSAQ